jgi:hypothetical protein
MNLLDIPMTLKHSSFILSQPIHTQLFLRVNHISILDWHDAPQPHHCRVANMKCYMPDLNVVLFHHQRNIVWISFEKMQTFHGPKTKNTGTYPEQQIYK